MEAQLHLCRQRILSRHHNRQHLWPQRRLPLCWTAQPRTTFPPAVADVEPEHESSSSKLTGNESTVATVVVAAQEVEEAGVITATSYNDIDGAGPLAEQLACQLVVVSANSSSSSTSAIVAAEHPSAVSSSSVQQPAGSVALPEGLPSPRAVDASLQSSMISFSRWESHAAQTQLMLQCVCWSSSQIRNV